MRAKRRHELKENVLAHELGKMKDFFRRYGNWIAGILVAVMIVFLVVWHYRSRLAGELTEQRNRYETLRRDIYTQERQSVEGGALAGLMELAENARDPLISASAAMDVADFCTGRYIDGLCRSDSEQARNYRKKAEKYYRLVIEKHADREVFVAKAHFGLGMLAENYNDWMAARSEYEQVCRLADRPSLAATEARMRLGGLQAWSQPVKFATTQPATAPAATQPTSRPAEGLSTGEPAEAGVGK